MGTYRACSASIPTVAASDQSAVDPALGVGGEVDVVDVDELPAAPAVDADPLLAVEELEVVGDRQPVGEVADEGDESRQTAEEGLAQAHLARGRDLLAAALIERVRRSQQRLAEHLLDLAELRPVGEG